MYEQTNCHLCGNEPDEKCKHELISDVELTFYVSEPVNTGHEDDIAEEVQWNQPEQRGVYVILYLFTLSIISFANTLLEAYSDGVAGHVFQNICLIELSE